MSNHKKAKSKTSDMKVNQQVVSRVMPSEALMSCTNRNTWRCVTVNSMKKR